MFIVLDLETTGLSPREDSIIECAFIKIDRKTGKEIDRLHSFVNPKIHIPDMISGITNIFDSDVAGSPTFDVLCEEIMDFIEGFPLIGHNISFDISFLESHGVDTSKNPKIDTFFLANFLCPLEKSLNLGFLCDVFGIQLRDAHRAIDDTVATAKLFMKLVGKLQSLTREHSSALYYFFSKAQDVGIHILRDEYLEKKKDAPLLQDIIMQYEKNIKKHMVKISETFQTHDTLNSSDFLSTIQGFEQRESQKIMIDKVDNIFTKGGKILIEAPTGIGKTFAYLIPAIQHSLRFGEPVHVSTSTKALQDQIFYKDLYFLSEHFPHEFSYTKLKGKRNYFSVSQFLQFLELEDKRSSGEISFILKLFFWSMNSEFGELDELDFYGEEYSFLGEIHAGNAFVFDDSNIHKDVEFAVRARRRAKNSNIIITNNHILFQDAISDGAILGEVKNLVIDEAHAIEDVVTSALKKNISYESLHKLLLKIEKKIIKTKIDSIDFMQVKQQILFDSAEIFSLLEGKIFETFSPGAKYKTILLQADDFNTEKQYALLGEKITELLQQVTEIIAALEKNKQQIFAGEVQQMVSYIFVIQESFIKPQFSEYIYYIQHDDNYGTQLNMTVLSPGSFLQSNFWNKLESIILTSATLQMQDDFAYIHSTLQTQGFQTVCLESDFDYTKQALVCIPNDLGSIKNNAEQVVLFLGEFFRVVRGNTLVLFTAFAIIRSVFTALKIELQKEGIYLLAQSISGSKHKQIESFKKNSHNSILLGTDSFWEGIDIPGEDLQYLLIHKIPFPVPSDPIFMARSKLYSNSFEQYAIPKSILKLKQGFGRLIRTKKDSGIVLFLDDRIYTTKWGEKFLSAFPVGIKVRYASSEKILSIFDRNKDEKM